MRGLEDRVAAVGGTLDDRQPGGRRHAAEARIPLSRGTAGRLARGGLRRRARGCAASCWCSRAGCGETDGRARAPVTVSGAPAAARRARRAPRRRGADRGRHPRPGVEQVLGDHPQRRRLRRAPARRARRLPVARRLQRRADERADRPGGRDQAGRPRGLDPRAGPRARDPARGAGRHPGRLDQLRQRPLQAPRRARPRRPDRGAAPGWRRGGGSPTRACGARCASTSRSATPASTPAAAGWREAMREAGGRSRVLPIADDDPPHARADRPRRRRRRAPTAC